MKKISYLSALLILISACSVNKADENNGRIEITNNEEELSIRYNLTDKVLTIDTTEANGFKSKKVKFDLKLESELSSPEVSGTTLQANMISYDNANSKWLISYNVQGATYLGGIDIAQVTGNGKNITLRSSVNFLDSDVNAVTGNSNNLYGALSTSNQEITDDGERSALQQLGLSGFLINEEDGETRSLPSFAANSIHTIDELIFITSGNTGGLTIFDTDLNELAFIEISESRWVNANQSNIFVLAGDSNGDNEGSILVIDKTDYQVTNEFGFLGAYTPEAKNSFEITGNLAVIAAGFEGTHIMDIRTGQLLATISIPEADELGLPSSVVTTNSVSVDENKIFISNGEAGVYVAEASINLEDYTSGTFDVTMLGKIQFDDLQSVNHVGYRNKILVVAAGTGGVKVVSLTDK